MPNIDRIIDAELNHIKNIGCVVKIIDDEYEEPYDLGEYNDEPRTNRFQRNDRRYHR